MHNKRRRLLATLFAAIVAIGALVGGVFTLAADKPEATPPQVEKTLEANGDGTYKLSLSVTGTSSKSSESSKANVVIVFDTSGSMDESTGQYTYTPTNEKNGTYGLVDGEYVELDYHRARWGWGRRNEYWTYGRGGTRYEGQRYLRTGGTRLQVAQQATTKLIDQLTANNTDENTDAVEISLVNFATNVKGTTDWSTDKDTLDTAVNAYTADGGTNWEAALKKAQELADAKHKAQPDEETYIIFVSDGNPTFRDSQLDSPAPVRNQDWLGNVWYTNASRGDAYEYSDGTVAMNGDGTVSQWGEGNDDTYGRNLKAAQNVVDSLDKSYHLYTIGAFGDADNMKNLGGTYYDATDEAALNAAFENILNEITNAVGYKNVQVTDNVTKLTANLIDTDAAKNFTYTKDGQPWTGDVPAASFKDGKVSWDLGDQTLEKGVTYTVSFDVWPSQEALDILADLKNGTKKYDDLTADQKAQIVKSGDGYALNTNTANGNDVTYKKVDSTTSNKQPDGFTPGEDGTWTAPDGTKWVQNEDGTYTGTKETPGKTGFTNPDPMPLVSSDMTLKKEFENGIDNYAVDSVDLTVTSDGSEYLKKTLTKTDSPAWSANLSIAPGIIKTTGDSYTVLETGHDYTVTEPAGEYHYDLAVATYHPMIIDGTLTMLAKDPSGSIKIGDDMYAVAQGTAGATITATNYRRSVIELSKTVESKTAGVTAPDKDFSFTGTVTDPKGANVWFSVKDADGNLVQDLTTSDSVTAEVKDGAKTGYYYVASGKPFTFSLKAGQNFRIINTPKGMTYSFTESDTMPDGFTFDEATSNGTKVEGKTVSGEVTASNTTYSVSFKNDYTSKPTTASIPVKKNLTVPEGLTAPDITGRYTFTLEAEDGAPMPDVASVKNPDSNGGTASFGEITYTEAGTYTYTVTESGTVTGVSNDSVAAKTVTVVVADNGEGKLVATVNGGKDLEFTNAYSVGETTATIPVEKTLSIPEGLTGPGDITGKYTFTLEAEGNAPMPETTKVTNPAANGGSTSFGPITYAKPGTYKYKVTESGTVDGVTNDPQATKEITVVVKDNSNGTLTATVNDGKAVSFTNTYSATSATINLGASKTLSAADGLNAPDVSGKYDLTIAAKTENAPMPEATSAKNPDGVGTAVNFGDITFTKEGDYTYTVSESGTVKGVTNDEQTSKEVTVHVADDGNGALKATVTSGSQVTNFTNTYTVRPCELDTNTNVLLKKTVTAEGTAWAGENGKSFNFTITPLEGAPAPMADGAVVTTGSATFTEAGTQPIGFGTITFTAPGEYKYELAEDTTNLGEGWECTGSPMTATVKVSDDGKGNLTAALEGDAATITNTYTTKPAELASSTTAVFTKKAESDLTLTKPATFTFTIAPVDGAPAPTNPEGSVTFDAAGQKNVDFGTFKFDKAGDYEYTVTEGTLPAGWTASSTTATIKIHVADNGQGKLVATVTQVGEITNSYGAKPATADPPVTKVVKGDVPTGKMPTFEFTIAPEDASYPMPKDADGNDVNTVTIPGAGSAEFGEISFTKPGTYAYTVTETKGGGAGWTNDNSAYKITYEVADNGEGALSVTRTITKGDQAVESDTFTNTYASSGKLDTATTAVLTKTVQNSIDDADAKWKSKQFDFTIAPATGNPAEVTIDNANGSATFTQPGTKTQTISFGNITFTKAGTYNFTLTETTQSGSGWTCDNRPKNVEVKVSDDGAGNLTATVTKAAEITNTYGDKPLQGDTAVKLSVNKTLTGTNLAAGQFAFELTPKTAGDTNAAQTKSNAADGTVSFDGLEYTKPGVYEYTISEVNDGKAGYTYDGTSAEVTVTVTDKGDGTMKAEVAYSKQTFSNSYKASGNTDGTIYAQKNLAGRALEEGQFSFQLKDSEGNVRQTKKNDASGRVIFDSIAYDQSIFGNEPATDSTTDKEDATEDNKSEDKSDDAAQDETKPESNAADEENKSTDSEATNGAAEPAPDSVDESAAQTEANTEESAEAEANPASTLVDALTSLVATPANAETTKRTKTFTYTISEVNDGKAGYEYDGHVETVKVTVTDEGNGKLSVVTTYDEDGAVFNNSYTASGETGDSIKATKKLTGRDGMTEGEFQFALLDKAGNTVATGKNAADGSVTFSSIKYNQNDASPKGTVHEYTMLEVVENDKAEKGMNYDTAKLPVKVTVTDKGDGHLATAVDYPEGNTFTNTYKPLTGNGYLTARKVLEGRDLKAGEFSFQLLDADGKVVATRTNDADGIVTFDGLSFDEAREYTFEVQEVKGDDDTITYDDKVAKYTVKVEDKGGQLTVTSVTADGSDQAPVFTNVYTAKESPKTPAAPASPAAPAKSSGATKSSGAVAKTGDTTTSVVGIVIAGAAIVAGGLYLRKRNTAAKK